MITGQNGILNRAGEAKEETERSQQEELEKLAGMEALTNINGYEYQGVNIPAGYIVSSKEGENSLEDGLVIKDASGNEFVWVEVPRSKVQEKAQEQDPKIDYNITNTTLTPEDYATIEAGLEAYAAPYTKGSATQNYTNWKDEWYEGCGLTQDEYKKNKEKMLKSIYENEGFWISRYEIGDEGGTIRTSSTNDNFLNQAIPVSKQNQVPYIYVTCSQAQELASKMAQESTVVTSSLLFGIQWDLVCKYLEVKLGSNVKVNGKNIINEDSSTWGNDKDSEIKLKRGKYLKYNSGLEKNWIEYNKETTNGYVESAQESYKKVKNKSILLTTGASNDAKKQNIYDLAGNLYEWTLEHATLLTSFPCARRGGNYYNDGSYSPASYRGYGDTGGSSDGIGFRVRTLLNVALCPV